jgi:hypothetical protein
VTPTLHQQHLLRLEGFCRGLGHALCRAGLGPAQVQAVWQSSVRAECVLCGIRVSGEELFALSQPPSALYGTAKLGRLRLGDCARHGCDSFYYRLTFQNYPRLNWPALLAEAEAFQPEQPSPPKRRGFAFRLPALPDFGEYSGFARRGLVVLAAILFLLVARQWYRGGSIPLVREPENFHIDAGPDVHPYQMESSR